ncbi:hypothetical protein BVY02_00510, partial [bacterium J17]
MSLSTGIIILGVIVALMLLLFIFFMMSSSGSGGHQGSSQVNSNLRSLVAAQRSQDESAPRHGKSKLALAAAAESELSQKKVSQTSRMTLGKKLRYARWPITELQFRAIQVLITVVFFFPAYLHLTIFLQILVVLLAPQILTSILDRSIGKRFKAFDD